MGAVPGIAPLQPQPHGPSSKVSLSVKPVGHKPCQLLRILSPLLSPGHGTRCQSGEVEQLATGDWPCRGRWRAFSSAGACLIVQPCPLCYFLQRAWYREGCFAAVTPTATSQPTRTRSRPALPMTHREHRSFLCQASLAEVLACYSEGPGGTGWPPLGLPLLKLSCAQAPLE